ncbi:MAG TPA: UvrD-helicase domain-containing protein, partial [Thermoanaerobaculia bacterium]
MSVTPQQGAFSFKPLTSEPARPARRNLVMEAGAGTGKTTAIVGEVLKLMLENEELAPERIVLVTFTEKAAGEIADRIREALVELHETQSEIWPVGSPNPLLTIAAAQRAAIAKQLARIDSLRSQTIHSFCQSLLRSFPIEAGLDPQFKIIEGFERSLLYGQLYDAWLDQETRVVADAAALAEWEFLFEHVGYLFQIRDLVFALLDRRDLLHETAYSLGEFEEVEPSLRGAVETLRRGNAAELKDEHVRRIVEYARSVIASEVEGSPDSGDERTHEGDPSTSLGMTRLSHWIAYLAPIAPHIREANLPRDAEMKEALKILRAGDKGRSMYDRLVSHRGALALLALTRRFTAFLAVEKRKLGVVDFDDLLLRTVDVLGDPVVLERARAQFDFIFVDEFQDTDRT